MKAQMVVAALLLAALESRAHAQATVNMSVLVSDGYTPARIGYNIHAQPTSAAWSWLRHSEVNGVRLWFGSGHAMQPFGSESVPTSSYQFITHRQNTRTEINSGPLGNTSAANCSAQLSSSTPSSWINWGHYFAEWESSGLRETFDEASRADVQIHVQLGLGSNAPLLGGADHWKSRWELWRHVFANAYYAATRWNVATWQIPYNEPDLHITKDVFVEKLRIASDAVQLAIKTVNKRRSYCGGTQLTARIIAPTTSSNPNIYTSATGSYAWPPPAPQPQSQPGQRSFCDPSIVDFGDACWGTSALQNRTATQFYGLSLSSADSFSTLFNAYSFHRYGGGAEGRLNFEDTWTYMRAFPGSPPLMPLYMTETNTHGEGNPDAPDSSRWSGYPTRTGDSPEEFPEYARMLMQHAQAETRVSGVTGEKNVYAFKFVQSSDHKTGMHHLGTDDAIGGVTNMGEVVRLYAKGFKSARPRLPISSSSGSVIGIASVASDEGVAYVMTANTSTSSYSVSLDRTMLGAPANQYVMMESITAQRRGDTTHFWSTGNRLTFTQPAQSVLLFTIPYDSLVLADIPASADAMVKGGVNRFTNYGTSDNLWASSSSNAGSRNVSFIRFNLNGIPKDDIRFGYLRVFGQSKTSSATGTETIAHVYGLIDDAWTETGIKGTNAPNLEYVDAATTRVADNFIDDIGYSAEFLGHLTGRSTAAPLGVDVTRWLKDHPDQLVTFMVIREIRFDPSYATNQAEDIPTDSTRSLWMASRETSDPTQRPRLLVAEH